MTLLVQSGEVCTSHERGDYRASHWIRSTVLSLLQVLPARVVSPAEPREAAGLYWGYSTRLAAGLGAALTDCPFEVQSTHTARVLTRDCATILSWGHTTRLAAGLGAALADCPLEVGVVSNHCERAAAQLLHLARFFLMMWPGKDSGGEDVSTAIG